MDNAEPEQGMEQDDELYVLLEKAISEERLCVSEELIQKTLKRVREQAKGKPRRKYYYAVRYACAAAAALLVIVLGGGILRLRQGGFRTKENMGEEPKNGDFSQIALTRENNPIVYHADPSALDGESAARSVSLGEEIPMDFKEENESIRAEEIIWYAAEFTVSAEFTKALEKAGYTVLTQEAEYWEFVRKDADGDCADDDWKQEMISVLYESEKSEIPFDGSGSGTYQYCLSQGKTSRVVTSGMPLYAAVRLQTEQGMLWILLGEELYLLGEE
ncbi:MAG: hypothetical protein J1E35_07830 [Lachnospiraceae bacterium]|nr:hypothetical protein [Lachnospiraceae bacterium]